MFMSIVYIAQENCFSDFDSNRKVVSFDRIWKAVPLNDKLQLRSRVNSFLALKVYIIKTTQRAFGDCIHSPAR